MLIRNSKKANKMEKYPSKLLVKMWSSQNFFSQTFGRNYRSLHLFWKPEYFSIKRYIH